jgi:hypothetical protein
MIIAQGKRGTSAALGCVAPNNFSPSPREARAGRGIKGEGLLNLTDAQKGRERGRVKP